jgi:hypothetical protein
MRERYKTVNAKIPGGAKRERKGKRASDKSIAWFIHLSGKVVNLGFLREQTELDNCIATPQSRFTLGIAIDIHGEELGHVRAFRAFRLRRETPEKSADSAGMRDEREPGQICNRVEGCGHFRTQRRQAGDVQLDRTFGFRLCNCMRTMTMYFRPNKFPRVSTTDRFVDATC